jgi:hypothetical protein
MEKLCQLMIARFDCCVMVSDRPAGPIVAAVAIATISRERSREA